VCSRANHVARRQWLDMYVGKFFGSLLMFQSLLVSDVKIQDTTEALTCW